MSNTKMTLFSEETPASVLTSPPATPANLAQKTVSFYFSDAFYSKLKQKTDSKMKTYSKLLKK